MKQKELIEKIQQFITDSDCEFSFTLLSFLYYIIIKEAYSFTIQEYAMRAVYESWNCEVTPISAKTSRILNANASMKKGISSSEEEACRIYEKFCDRFYKTQIKTIEFAGILSTFMVAWKHRVDGKAPFSFTKEAVTITQEWIPFFEHNYCEIYRYILATLLGKLHTKGKKDIQTSILKTVPRKDEQNVPHVVKVIRSAKGTAHNYYICEIKEKRFRIVIKKDQTIENAPETIVCHYCGTDDMGFPRYIQYTDEIGKNNLTNYFNSTQQVKQEDTPPTIKQKEEATTPKSTSPSDIKKTQAETELKESSGIFSTVKKWFGLGPKEVTRKIDNTSKIPSEVPQTNNQTTQVPSSKTQSRSLTNPSTTPETTIQGWKDCTTRIIQLQQYPWCSVTRNIKNNESNNLWVKCHILLGIARCIDIHHKKDLILKNFTLDHFIVRDQMFDISLSPEIKTYLTTEMADCSQEYKYVAPEVKHGLTPYTSSSDCYLFSAIAYEVLSGEEYSDSNEFADCFLISEAMQDLYILQADSDYLARPDMGMWIKALEESICDLNYCDNCNKWYFYSHDFACINCGAKPKERVYIQIHNEINDRCYIPKTNSFVQQWQILKQPEVKYLCTDTRKVMFMKSLLTMEAKDHQTIMVTMVQINQVNSKVKVKIEMSSGIDLIYNQSGKPVQSSSIIEIGKGEEVDLAVRNLDTDPIRRIIRIRY